jgi:hypothetical protein
MRQCPACEFMVYVAQKRLIMQVNSTRNHPFTLSGDQSIKSVKWLDPLLKRLSLSPLASLAYKSASHPPTQPTKTSQLPTPTQQLFTNSPSLCIHCYIRISLLQLYILSVLCVLYQVTSSTFCFHAPPFSHYNFTQPSTNPTSLLHISSA